MTRSLHKRIELMFPVENVEQKAKVLYTFGFAGARAGGIGLST